MRVHAFAINRREFLKRSSILGLGSLSALASERTISAASKNRVVVFQGVGLDSLHPYAYSGGGISGIWQHVIEPLIEMDFSRNEYIGVLAESWEYQGKRWIFHLRKKVRFHDGSPLTSKDVLFSIDRMINDRKSLQASNFAEVTGIEAPDDYTVTITTKQPNAVLLERLNNRFIDSQSATEKTVISSITTKSAPGRTNWSAGSAPGIWCSRATTTIGAPRRRSKRYYSTQSKRKPRASPGCWQVKRTRSAICPSKKLSGLKKIHAPASKEFRATACIFWR